RVGDAAGRADLRRMGGAGVALARVGVAAAVEEGEGGDRRRLGQRLQEEHGDGLAGTGQSRRDAGRDPRLLLPGQADPEVETERARDLLPEERAQRAARDAPYELAHEEAEGEGVGAVACTGFPERLLRRQPV